MNVFHPFSSFRKNWDSLTIILVVIQAVVLPFQIAFYYPKNYSFLDTPKLSSLKFVTDVWFLIDIMFNFRTAFYNADGLIEGEIPAIRCNYLKTWFAFDLLAALPVDIAATLYQASNPAAVQSRTLIQQSRITSLKLIKLTRLLSLSRLLRLVKFKHYMQHIENYFGLDYGVVYSYTRLFYSLLGLLYWVHLDCCITFGLHYWLHDAGGEYFKTSWINESGLHPKEPWEQYCWAFFRCLSHVLAIGYGTETPRNIVDCWLIIISQISEIFHQKASQVS